MHSLLPIRRSQCASRLNALAGVLILSVVLAACTTNVSYEHPTVESRDVGEGYPTDNQCYGAGCPDQGDTVGGLPPRDLDLERARYFENQAQSRSNEAAQIEATLNAAEYYVQADQADKSVQLLSDLQRQGVSTFSFSDVQRDRADIIYAYYDYANNNCDAALNRLARFSPQERTVEYVDPRTLPEYQARQERLSTLPIDQTGNETNSFNPDEREILEQPILSDVEPLTSQQVDALLLSSFCYQQLQMYDAQINALIQREQGLRGQAQAQSTRYTWQVINALPIFTREQLLQSSNYAAIKPRLEQSLAGTTSSQVTEVNQFTNLPDFRETQAQRVEPKWTNQSVKQIAVLLPLSSKFNKAATAVLDGIKYEHAANLSGYAPELLIYDIGDSVFQTSQYYRAAINQGADFVIGPLGKEFADQLLQENNQFNLVRTPTLLLGGQLPLAANLARFTLSPEAEGVAIARKAFRDGLLSAAIMASSSVNSQRMTAAFEQEWLRLGGRISARSRFSPTQFDHSVELKLMFNIGASEYRAKQLADVLGFSPEHNAYQRDDIDFVFMVASASEGRILRPQINFFSGGKLPVYSGSEVYTGVPDAINDMDLEQTLFPVMPWVLISADSSEYAGQLNQLFALGADSYSLASQYSPRESRWQLDTDSVLKGKTGWLTLPASRDVYSEPLWASFAEGLPSVDNNQGFDLTPIGSDEDTQENENANADTDALDSEQDNRESIDTLERFR